MLLLLVSCCGNWLSTYPKFSEFASFAFSFLNAARACVCLALRRREKKRSEYPILHVSERARDDVGLRIGVVAHDGL